MQRRRRRGLELPGETTDPQSLTCLGLDFLQWLRVHNYSKDTVRVRRSGLSSFLRWALPRGLLRPEQLTRRDLERYQRHLHYQPSASGQPLSVKTQYGRLSSLRMFFRWLTRQGHLLHNPASELELPRLGQRLPAHVLSPEKVEQVLAQPDVETLKGVRDRAILETLYSTGMRRQELLGLTLEDVDLGQGLVMVRQGKGNKDRLIPLGRRAGAWLSRYLLEVRPRLLADPEERRVFLTLLGPPPGTRWLSRCVSRYIRSAGLGPIGACHLFRHSMATGMLNNGADLRYIQQILGHAHLSTTQIYTRVSLRQLQQVHGTTHPAETGRTARMLRQQADEQGQERTAEEGEDEQPADEH